jgi:heme/copper-type cytochrome/quinol oxidase subunit 2
MKDGQLYFFMVLGIVVFMIWIVIKFAVPCRFSEKNGHENAYMHKKELNCSYDRTKKNYKPVCGDFGP